MALESILTGTKPISFINDLADFIVDPNIGGVTPLDLETTAAGKRNRFSTRILSRLCQILPHVSS